MSMSKSNEQNEKGKSEKSRSWTVYVHTNKSNGKRYVGITSRVPELRWQNGTAYRNNTHFNAAIQQDGWDGFEHDIIAQGLSFDKACEMEREYIKQYNLTDRRYGYNMTDGGEGICGYEFSAEQRQRMRANNSGQKNPCYGRTGSLHPMYGRRGKDNPNYGRVATEEQRRHMSESRLGIQFSEQYLLHMRQSAKRGKDAPNSRSVAMYNADGVLVQTFDTITDAAQSVGADRSNIVACCRGKIKKSKGYIWRYADT